jgi:hypothetical protein
MLGKRRRGLDEPSEEEMKSSCGKVEAMFSTSEKKNFVPSFIPESTVYRDQGMRDGEAIYKLKILEKGTDIVQVKVLELIKLLPFFAQPIVSCFIEQNKNNLPNVKELVLLAQDDTE